MQTQNAQDEESVTASLDAIVVGAGVSGMYPLTICVMNLGYKSVDLMAATRWWHLVVQPLPECSG